MARRSTSSASIAASRCAPDLALEAVFGEIAGKGNAGLCLAQGGSDLGGIISDRGNNPQTRDNYPSHVFRPFRFFLSRSSVRRRNQAVLSFDRTDAQVACLINDFAIGLEPAVGGAEHEAAAHDALEIDAVFKKLRRAGGSCP